MKHLVYLLIPAMIFASCGGNQDKDQQLAKLKKDRGELDLKIKSLEAGKKDSAQVVPVSVTEVQPAEFNAFVEVQSVIGGDEVVNATPKAPGTVQKVLVQVGQKVHAGQMLASLDGNVVDQQINALEPQLELQKSLYEKQQSLWAQNIGTEVQLMSAKAQYEATQKQKLALQAQRYLYNIVSPITGMIDAVGIKVGDMASPGMNGFRVVNLDKLKAEANLGENYLGQIHQGDPVILVLQGTNDSIKTKLTYVAEAVDPASRAFLVQVRLGYNKKLHPNMSCVMKIINYNNPQALIVPISVIQKTSQGNMLYIADGNKSKAVYVTLGRNANGMVEILSGLKAGDKVITRGYEEMDNGKQLDII